MLMLLKKENQQYAELLGWRQKSPYLVLRVQLEVKHLSPTEDDDDDDLVFYITFNII